MEATFVQCDEQHPFVKFQIMQYASIYEAVITNLLWGKFKDYDEVLKLQTHKAYKPVQALGSLTKVKYGEEEIFTCVYRDSKTPKNSIRESRWALYFWLTDRLHKLSPEFIE